MSAILESVFDDLLLNVLRSQVAFSLPGRLMHIVARSNEIIPHPAGCALLFPHFIGRKLTQGPEAWR